MDYRRFRDFLAPLPERISQIIARRAWEVAKRNAAGLFIGQKGVRTLLDPWAVIFYDIGQELDLPMVPEDATLMSGALVEALCRIDGGIDVAEQVLSRVPILAIPSIGLRLSRDAVITWIVCRAAAHVLLEYRDCGTLLPEELANIIISKFFK